MVWWTGAGYDNDGLGTVLTNQWVDFDLYIDWAFELAYLYQNGELIATPEPYEVASYEDIIRFNEVDGFDVWLDDIYFWLHEDESLGYSMGGGWSFLLDDLEPDTFYCCNAMIVDSTSLGSSDYILCKTSGSAPFPVWLILVLVVVVILGIYTKSLILSIAGIILCVVSYSWLLQASTADDVGVWGGAAFFLILIAWIILNLVYRNRHG